MQRPRLQSFSIRVTWWVLWVAMVLLRRVILLVPCSQSHSWAWIAMVCQWYSMRKVRWQPMTSTSKSVQRPTSWSMKVLPTHHIQVRLAICLPIVVSVWTCSSLMPSVMSYALILSSVHVITTLFPWPMRSRTVGWQQVRRRKPTFRVSFQRASIWQTPMFAWVTTLTTTAMHVLQRATSSASKRFL